MRDEDDSVSEILKILEHHIVRAYGIQIDNTKVFTRKEALPTLKVRETF